MILSSSLNRALVSRTLFPYCTFGSTLYISEKSSGLTFPAHILQMPAKFFIKFCWLQIIFILDEVFVCLFLPVKYPFIFAFSSSSDSDPDIFLVHPVNEIRSTGMHICTYCIRICVLKYMYSPAYMLCVYISIYAFFSKDTINVSRYMKFNM